MVTCPRGPRWTTHVAMPVTRRGSAKRASVTKQKRPKRGREEDEQLDSGEDSGDEEAAHHARLLADEAAKDEEAAEPAAERRVRLAKEMIAAMDAAASKRSGEAAGSSGVARGAHQADAVAEALEEDAMRRAGKWRHKLAASLRGASIAPGDVRRLRGPRLSPTCVAIAPDESFVVCGCKDGSLVKWMLPDGEPVKLHGGRAAAYHPADADDADAGDGAGEATDGNGGMHLGPKQQFRRRKPTRPVSEAFASAPTGHLADVLSVAVSADSKLIASGGRDGAMLLWDAQTNEVVHRFRGHRGPINALATRRDATDSLSAHPELYSASSDRTARVWDLEQRGYVETLYGHQEPITALDALDAQIVLSAGEDRTVRLWKVAEETQLLFANGHNAPVDAVALTHADGFVSGGQDGQLTMWSAKRKKPVCSVPSAHGVAPWGGPCWVSALCAPNCTPQH